MIAGMTFYQIAWYFILYSFFGWCLEVAYHGVTLGKVVNRGFLNGPVCPVYGFGMLAVLSIGNLSESALGSSGPSIMSGNDAYGTLLLFIGGVVLATAVELIAGWALDKLFHTRWWDYSNKPFNFHGYICLEFSLLWGLGAVLVVRVLQPILETKSTTQIPERYGWPILAVLYALYLADFIVTCATINGLNKKLDELDRMRASMRVLSDNLSEVIGTTATVTAQRLQEGQIQASLAKAELKDAAAVKRSEAADSAALRKAKMEAQKAQAKEELRKRSAETKAELEKRSSAAKASYEQKLEELRTSRSARRLALAFPQLRHHDHKELVEDLRKLF